MRIRRYIGLCAAVLAASMSASYAGPCLDEIDTMQAKIDAKLEAIAAAGPPATPAPWRDRTVLNRLHAP
jgi:hypothetical protein